MTVELVSNLVGTPEDQFSRVTAQIETCFTATSMKQTSPTVYISEPSREKTNNVDFKQVRHKLVCIVTEYGWKLEIIDLESRGTVLSVQQKQKS